GPENSRDQWPTSRFCRRCCRKYSTNGSSFPNPGSSNLSAGIEPRIALPQGKILWQHSRLVQALKFIHSLNELVRLFYPVLRKKGYPNSQDVMGPVARFFSI